MDRILIVLGSGFYLASFSFSYFVNFDSSVMFVVFSSSFNWCHVMIMFHFTVHPVIYLHHSLFYTLYPCIVSTLIFRTFHLLMHTLTTPFYYLITHDYIFLPVLYWTFCNFVDFWHRVDINWLVSFDTIGAVFFSLLHLNYNFVSTLIMYQQIM